MLLGPLLAHAARWLGASSNANAVVIGLRLLERAIPISNEGREFALTLAADPSWAARYLAGKRLGHMANGAPDSVWRALVRLAEDEHAAVSSGASWGFGALLEHDPTHWFPRFAAMLQDSTVSVALQRSIILAVIPPLRHHRTDLLDDIVMLLNAAIAAERSGPAGLVGSHIVGQEMARELPEQAMALVERWAASESAAARRQAARTLSGPLVSHFPDRVAAVRCGLEEQAPTDSRLRAALDAAGRKRMRSERRRRDTLGEDDDAGADAAPVVRR